MFNLSVFVRCANIDINGDIIEILSAQEHSWLLAVVTSADWQRPKSVRSSGTATDTQTAPTCIIRYFTFSDSNYRYQNYEKSDSRHHLYHTKYFSLRINDVWKCSGRFHPWSALEISPVAEHRWEFLERRTVCAHFVMYYYGVCSQLRSLLSGTKTLPANWTNLFIPVRNFEWSNENVLYKQSEFAKFVKSKNSFLYQLRCWLTVILLMAFGDL